jgi:hypothetical protein
MPCAPFVAGHEKNKNTLKLLIQSILLFLALKLNANVQAQNYSEEKLQCFLSLVSEGLKRNNHRHLITNECEKRSKWSEINGKITLPNYDTKAIRKIVDGLAANCEESTRIAPVPSRNETNSNAMTEVLPPLGGRNTQLGIEISNVMTKVLPPLGGRNAQSGKENVESSVGKETGRSIALSRGMPGVLGVAWAITKVFDPGGLATSTQISYELAAIERFNHSNLAMHFCNIANAVVE